MAASSVTRHFWKDRVEPPWEAKLQWRRAAVAVAMQKMRTWEGQSKAAKQGERPAEASTIKVACRSFCTRGFSAWWMGHWRSTTEVSVESLKVERMWRRRIRRHHVTNSLKDGFCLMAAVVSRDQHHESGDYCCILLSFINVGKSVTIWNML